MILCAGKTDWQNMPCNSLEHAQGIADRWAGKDVKDRRIFTSVTAKRSTGWHAILAHHLALVWESDPSDESASWDRLVAWCQREGWRPYRLPSDHTDPLKAVRLDMIAKQSVTLI